MISQILTDTSISANWVMAGAVSVACFLLWRILSRMEKRLEIHEGDIKKLQSDVRVIEVTAKPEVVASAVMKALRDDPSFVKQRAQ